VYKRQAGRSKVIFLVLLAVLILVVGVNLFINSFDSQDTRVYAEPIEALVENVYVNYEGFKPAAAPIVNKIKPEHVEKRLRRNIDTIKHEAPPHIEHTPHQWLAVNPTSEQKRLCSLLERPPLKFTRIYDPDSKRYMNRYYGFFEINISVLFRGEYRPLEHYFSEQFVDDLKWELRRNLLFVYQEYMDWFEPENLSKSVIDLKVTLNDKQYFNELVKHGAESSVNNPGVYIPWIHQAYINLPRYDNGYLNRTLFIDILTHEAVHAINFVQFGYMQRWAQEGLAQYFAYRSESGEHLASLRIDEWDKRTGSMSQPFVMDDLIIPNKSWQEDEAILYASSLVYTQYFSSLPKDKNPFISFLYNEMLPRCSTVNEENTIDLLDPENMLNSDFFNWFEKNVYLYNK